MASPFTLVRGEPPNGTSAREQPQPAEQPATSGPVLAPEPVAVRIAEGLLARLSTELAKDRLPLATYRLQLHRGFGFAAARALVPYLAQLGATDLYSSPVLTATPGSNHGYDVLDHGALNPELGPPEEHAALSQALRDQGLGQVLDIVPNHMGVGNGNALWRDLLENGPSARGARFFDVEWHPVKEELVDKVLLPLLGDRFGAELESGRLKLIYEAGSFEIGYWDNRFPVNPRSYREVLSARIDELEARLSAGSEQDRAALDELKSIVRSLDHLPGRREQDPARMEERQREKEVVKRRLAQLCEQSAPVREHLLESVRRFNGVQGQPHSFDALERLLDVQAYRLAHWRVSSEEINYRRFFDINSLAAIRVEDPEVFEHVHKLPLQMLERGQITGLRIDHPDGLALPTRYFRLLQEKHVLQRARALAEREGVLREVPWEELEPALRTQLGRELAALGKRSPLFRPLYVVAEKILGRTERLPDSWAVRGTTGYDFLNALNGIFVDQVNEESLSRTYARFIGARTDFKQLLTEKKKLILYTALASQMNQLARELNRISEGSRWTRDFTLYALRAALIEVVACFPVYRTYVGDDDQVDARDRRLIEQAVAEARRQNPAQNASIYAFLESILLQRFDEHVDPAERERQRAFVLKLQQILGPVMAKGLEDTLFYVYMRLSSLNEVGGEPQIFGTTMDEFHAQNALRARQFNRALSATATHDTKRGEDLRTRVDALSELPREWSRMLASCHRLTEPFRADIDGRRAPDRNELMLFWQTLLGAWPLPSGAPAAPRWEPLSLPPPEVMASLRERMQQYLFKAIKEAKVNTSWIQDDPAWEKAVTGFVEGVLSLPARHRLWKVFLPFQRQVALIGLHSSLSQLLLKIASPGVPDFFQGTELWDLSLVDPDNRRPVDFGLRQRWLAELRESLAARSPMEVARELYSSWEDGRIKLLVTHLGLLVRRAHPELFGEGGYLPLAPEGSFARHLAAFARTSPDGRMAIAVAPRLVAPLLDGDGRNARLDPRKLAGTVIPIPGAAPGEKLRDALTGEERTLFPHGGGAALAADALLSTLPVALLLRG